MLEDDFGRVVMASLARLTCEIYLLVDRGVGPRRGEGKPTAALDARKRYEQMLLLHEACEKDLLARGLDDAHAWLPPPIAKRFGRRLEALGWIRDDAWTPYCFRLGEKHGHGYMKCADTRFAHASLRFAGPGLAGTHHKTVAY